ncbi:hypothetical protein ACLK1S_13785 [Escherichia coli]
MTKLFSRHAQRFVGFAVVTAAVGESALRGDVVTLSLSPAIRANGERASRRRR